MSTAPAQAKQYRAIRAWGSMMGSFDSYIVREQERAAADSAPITAVYDQGNGNWATIESIKNTNALKTIATYLAHQS